MPDTMDVDYLIIGGGFYGCALGLFLRSICKKVTIVEAAPQILTRASRVNQARVHTGFHYPRSALTAVKSMALHQRFAADFPEAVHDQFDMLYAIARHHSKVSAGRFHRMFEQMGAPIAPATRSQAALFDDRMIEQAFRCTEHAFDYSVLRRGMENQLDRLDFDLRLSTEVINIEEKTDFVLVHLSDGTSVRAGQVYNITYSRVNHILRMADLPAAHLKHEVAEVALITPPDELSPYGITVMDGPFFSTMPYPAEEKYSLTHVRYTVHKSWCDRDMMIDPYAELSAMRLQSRAPYMIRDAARYLPSLAQAQAETSLFEVKTVLMKNEADDGRPILYQRLPARSRITSILGAKIDNIYDLFDLVRREDPQFAHASEQHLVDRSMKASAE